MNSLSLSPSFIMAVKILPDELYIRFYHPDMKYLSDRTFKQLITEIAKLCRRTLIEEAFDFIDQLDIEYPSKQSIKDRISENIPSIPSFYLEDVEKGSVEILICVSASGLWLLKETVAKSLADGYKKSALNTDIENASLAIFNKVSEYVVHRPQQLIKKLAVQIKNKKLGNRFQITDTSVEPTKNSHILGATIESTDAHTNEGYKTVRNNSSLRKELKEEIESLRNGKNKTKKSKVRKNKRKNR